MSVYRDQLEACPRCTMDLVDAGSVRGCTACSGLWVSAHVLRAMIEVMLEPKRPVTIELEPEARPQLACPSCAKPMETWLFHGVAIDGCRGHGIWFDDRELQQVLMAVAAEEADYSPYPELTVARGLFGRRSL